MLACGNGKEVTGAGSLAEVAPTGLFVPAEWKGRGKQQRLMPDFQSTRLREWCAPFITRSSRERKGWEGISWRVTCCTYCSWDSKKTFCWQSLELTRNAGLEAQMKRLILEVLAVETSQVVMLSELEGRVEKERLRAWDGIWGIIAASWSGSGGERRSWLETGQAPGECGVWEPRQQVSGKKGEARVHYYRQAEDGGDWGEKTPMSITLMLSDFVGFSLGDSCFRFYELIDICILGPGVCLYSET